MDGKSEYFLAGEVTKSSPVRYRERLSKMQISRALRPMLCCQYSQRSPGTIVNPDTGWIRENVEIFESGKKNCGFKKISRYVWTWPKLTSSCTGIITYQMNLRNKMTKLHYTSSKNDSYHWRQFPHGEIKDLLHFGTN